MKRDLPAVLREHGIRPSAQRVAVASYVLDTGEHPSADRVFSRVRRRFSLVSRATVYNTLNLFVRRGLVRPLVLAEGRVVFDPKVAPHHHFIDLATGRIHDIPWSAFRVLGLGALEGFEIKEYQVVLRGRRSAGRHGRSVAGNRKGRLRIFRSFERGVALARQTLGVGPAKPPVESPRP